MSGFLEKKSRIKPFYKQMIKLRENVLHRKKILKFKRLKWSTYIFHIRRKLSNPYFRYKVKNTRGYTVSSKPNNWEGREGKYRNILHTYKRFKLFYGIYSKNSAKRVIREIKKSHNGQNVLKLVFYRVMERRLDSVIYRAKFSHTIKSAKQFILRGDVTVNGNVVKKPTFPLHSGDLVKLSAHEHTLREIIIRFDENAWPHSPSHLNINYKTLEILIGEINYKDLHSCFHFSIKPTNMVLDFFYQ
jgi:small subunit ribosomal protein S4